MAQLAGPYLFPRSALCGRHLRCANACVAGCEACNPTYGVPSRYNARGAVRTTAMLAVLAHGAHRQAKGIASVHVHRVTLRYIPLCKFCSRAW